MEYKESLGMFEKVYREVCKIPRGKVATYGQLAKLIGTRDARKVGFALHANKDPNTPCHRVVNKEGRLAPNFAFSAKSDKSRNSGGPAKNRTSRPVRRVREGRLGGEGPNEQRRRLEAEGVKFKSEMYVDLAACLWQSI